MGFDLFRGSAPIHLSHTYLEGSAALDDIERVVRGTARTYGGPHGAILKRYGRADSVVFNLLAYDRDPRTEHGARSSVMSAFDKPRHEIMRYDAFDPLVGDLVEAIRDRSASVCNAAWRGKLGLARTPEYWVEWRCDRPVTLRELGDGFRAWRAPRVVKTRIAAGWRLLAMRIG